MLWRRLALLMRDVYSAAVATKVQSVSPELWLAVLASSCAAGDGLWGFQLFWCLALATVVGIVHGVPRFLLRPRVLALVVSLPAIAAGFDGAAWPLANWARIGVMGAAAFAIAIDWRRPPRRHIWLLLLLYPGLMILVGYGLEQLRRVGLVYEVGALLLAVCFLVWFFDFRMPRRKSCGSPDDKPMHDNAGPR